MLRHNRSSVVFLQLVWHFFQAICYFSPVPYCSLPVECSLVLEEPANFSSVLQFVKVNETRVTGRVDLLTKPKQETELEFRSPTVIPTGQPKPDTPVLEPLGPAGRVPSFTPKPVCYEGCALPLEPAPEDLTSSGFRFGAQPNSRLEFNTQRGKYRKNFDFSLDFKTTEANGIIFYVSDGKTQQSYVALLLQDGYVIFTFKGEHPDPLILKSQMTYPDNEWHFVEFSRDGADAKLVIDGGSINKRIPHKIPTLDLHIPFYLGGLQPDDYNRVQPNLNTTTPFNGCIKNFQMNSKPLENPKNFGVIPCSEHVETGTFFGGGLNTYIKLKEHYKIGQMFNIKMDIKPRSNSGVLMAVHGKKDYFVLEMVNGNLRLTVENGRGPVTATYIPPGNNNFSLCDGNWHEVQAVKSKNVVKLSVDNVFTDPKIGNHSAISSDTDSALFLGGHRLILRVRGITSHSPYVGCLKNVHLNNDPIELQTTMVEGNITIGNCRTN